MKVMSRKDRFLFITLTVLLINSCTINEKKGNSIDYDNLVRETGNRILGKKEFTNLYKKASDTLSSWQQNGLYADKLEGAHYSLDSLICINSKKDKLIGVRLGFFNSYLKGKYTEGISEFYGAKINGNWYFWSGGYMPVPRSLFKGHDPKKPLSYAQLHSQALDFMSGYLDANGNIRDEWFESKFKGSGWGYFKDRYKYKSTLDGHQVDSEQGYYNYLWKKGGLMNWISKFSNDSIRKQEDFLGHRLSTEEKNEIRMFITRKLMNSQFPMYRGKYKG